MMKGSALTSGQDFLKPRLMVPVAAVVAIAAMAWQGYADWRLLQLTTDHHPIPEQTVSTTPAKVTPAATISVTALNLMGEKPTEPEVVAAPPVVIPQTTLQLRLAGSFSSPNEALAAAFIAVDGQGSRYFRVGDIITEDVQLFAVDTDSVTLKRSTGFEKLYFAGAAPTAAASAATVPATASAPRATTPPVGPAAVTSAAVAVVSPSASAYLPQDLSLQERLDRLRTAQRQTR